MSAAPGRIRLRAAGGGRAADQLEDTARALGAAPDVTAVEVRPRSGSVVVRFEPGGASKVEEQLRAMGVTAEDTLAGKDPATVIASGAGALNRAVASRVGGHDLRLLMPLALGLLSTRQALRGRDRLADAPWYVLAWYAAESFMRHHGRAADREPEVVG